MFQDAIVHCVQVSDIEGWEEESLGKSSRKKIFPGIISHEDHTPSCRDMRVGHSLRRSQGRGIEKRRPFKNLSETSTVHSKAQQFHPATLYPSKPKIFSQEAFPDNHTFPNNQISHSLFLQKALLAFSPWLSLQLCFSWVYAAFFKSVSGQGMDPLHSPPHL